MRNLILMWCGSDLDEMRILILKWSPLLSSPQTIRGTQVYKRRFVFVLAVNTGMNAGLNACTLIFKCISF